MNWMNEMREQFLFVAALGLTALMKIRLSPWLGWRNALTTSAVAILAAVVFTPLLLDYLSLDAIKYAPGAAVVIGLSFEQLTRWVLSKTPEELLNLWRGRGGNRD